MAWTLELLQAYSFDPISIVVFTQYDFTDFDCTLLYCMYTLKAWPWDGMHKWHKDGGYAGGQMQSSSTRYFVEVHCGDRL